MLAAVRVGVRDIHPSDPVPVAPDLAERGLGQVLGERPVAAGQQPCRAQHGPGSPPDEHGEVRRFPRDVPASAGFSNCHTHNQYLGRGKVAANPPLIPGRAYGVDPRPGLFDRTLPTPGLAGYRVKHAVSLIRLERARLVPGAPWRRGLLTWQACILRPGPACCSRLAVLIRMSVTQLCYQGRDTAKS